MHNNATPLSTSTERSVVTASESAVATEKEELPNEPPAKKAKPEKILGLPNGGKLVLESKWDQLKSAICCIKGEGATGFIACHSECLYLMTTLHTFISAEEQKKIKDMKTFCQKVMTKAREEKYRFFYTEEWKPERVKEEEVSGEDIIHPPSRHVSAKADQVLDVVAVPLRDGFGEKHPKIHPISLDLEEYKDIEKWNGYYITLIGHAYGLPLSRAIAFVTENFGQKIAYDCDTASGSSGSPVVVATKTDKLTVFAMHTGADVHKERNVASLLSPFVSSKLGV